MRLWGSCPADEPTTASGSSLWLLPAKREERLPQVGQHAGHATLRATKHLLFEWHDALSPTCKEIPHTHMAKPSQLSADTLSPMRKAARSSVDTSCGQIRKGE